MPVGPIEGDEMSAEVSWAVLTACLSTAFDGVVGVASCPPVVAAISRASDESHSALCGSLTTGASRVASTMKGVLMARCCRKSLMVIRDGAKTLLEAVFLHRPEAFAGPPATMAPCSPRAFLRLCRSAMAFARERCLDSSTSAPSTTTRYAQSSLPLEAFQTP